MNQLIFSLLLFTTIISNAHSKPSNLYTNKTHKFIISEPIGWAQVLAINGVVWQIASKNETELPTCGVIVAQDWSLVGNNDNYIVRSKKEDFIELLSLQLSDVKIGKIERNFKLGGQRAIHFIWTSTKDGVKQMSLTTQTIRGDKIYTYFCNSSPESFWGNYPKFLQISDTFKFSPLK